MRLSANYNLLYIYVACHSIHCITLDAFHHHHHHHHIVRFYVRFTCWHVLDSFQKINFQANLFLARSLLTLLSLKSIFTTSSHVFFGLCTSIVSFTYHFSPCSTYVSSALTGQVSLPYIITLPTHA